MSKNRAYGAGGKPLFLRLNDTERAAWEGLKSSLEAEVGSRISHSLFATLLISRSWASLGLSR